MPDFQTITERLNETVAAARANSNLSADGRKRIVAAAYMKADNAVAKIKAQEAEQRASARRSAEDHLFAPRWSERGDPNAMMLYRDANDRASRLTSSDEAIRLLESSALGGDDMMARAILGQGMRDPRLQGIVEKYIEVMPRDTQAIDDLLELNAADAQASSRAARITREMNSSLPRPEEIRNYPEQAIADLAAEALDVQETKPAPTYSGGGAAQTWRLVGGYDMATGERHTEVIE